MRGVAPALTLTPRGPASGRRAAEGTSRVPSRGRGAWHRVETDILSCAGLFHSRGQWGGGKRPGERGHCPESGEERSHLRAVAGAGLQQSDATCRCAPPTARSAPRRREKTVNVGVRPPGRGAALDASPALDVSPGLTVCRAAAARQARRSPCARAASPRPGDRAAPALAAWTCLPDLLSRL